jgi:guanylate kinase
MEDVKRGNLFVVSGPSGAGKGAICAGLTAETDTMLSVSMTTRAPRENETEGLSYHFVDKDRFRAILKEDGFIEHAEVFGEYYGTPKAPVIQSLEAGRDVILEIEVEGAKQVKEHMPEAILVFILPPSRSELRKRIEGRGTETAEKIEKRLERVDMEISQICKYDYLVINDDLARATGDMLAIMQAEKLRVREDTGTIIKKYYTGDNI